jgi:hypothetical protein
MSHNYNVFPAILIRSYLFITLSKVGSPTSRGGALRDGKNISPAGVINAFLVSNYLCRSSGVKSCCAELIAAGNLTHWLAATVTAANRFALLAFGHFRFAAELDAPRLALATIGWCARGSI